MQEFIDWKDNGRLCTCYRDDGSRVTGHVCIDDVIMGDPEIPIATIHGEDGNEYSAYDFCRFLVS